MKMTFGDNLISLRKKNKMTQEEIADKLEVTRQTISNWELNQTKPDLEQLRGLSKLYKLSIDELVDNNIQGSIAKKHINRNLAELFYKNRKIWLMIFTLICFIAIGICTIVDIAINNKITWGIYPILSISFGYLIIVPLFARKNGIVLSLISLSLTILPFLYLLEKFVPIKNWFYSLALPITIFNIIAMWIIYSINKFLKINSWYKVSIIIFICGGIISPVTNYMSGDVEIISFQNFINVFSSIIVSAACAIYGYVKNKKI